MPVPWLQAVDALGVGCLLFGGAIAWLAAGELAADAAGKVPLMWALVAIAVFSRSAPASINAMMIGVFYLSIFAGSAISGRLGGLYERLSSAQFWLIHAASAAAGGVLILLFASRLRRELMPCAGG
jgi:POT family proton-dependent oligopeptide transporter